MQIVEVLKYARIPVRLNVKKGESVLILTGTSMERVVYESLAAAARAIFATVPLYRNQAKRFRQIEENTFVPLDGREEGIPHYYFDEERIRKFLSAFNILDIHVDSKKHHCFLGEKSGY